MEGFTTKVSPEPDPASRMKTAARWRDILRATARLQSTEPETEPSSNHEFEPSIETADEHDADQPRPTDD